MTILTLSGCRWMPCLSHHSCASVSHESSDFILYNILLCVLRCTCPQLCALPPQQVRHQHIPERGTRAPRHNSPHTDNTCCEGQGNAPPANLGVTGSVDVDPQWCVGRGSAMGDCEAHQRVATVSSPAASVTNPNSNRSLHTYPRERGLQTRRRGGWSWGWGGKLWGRRELDALEA